MINTSIKTYPRIFSLAFIFFASCIVMYAQNNKTINNAFTAKQLKGTALKSELSIGVGLAGQKEVMKAIDFIELSRKKHDDMSDQAISLAVDETPTDSAYVYQWNADWDLKYRIYYFFNTLSINITQEKYNPDNTWSKYSERILDFYYTGNFKSETERYWKSTSSDWKIGYFEEYNLQGRRTEIYSKNWNDTTQEFTEGYRIVSGYKKDTLVELELFQEWDVASKGWKNLIRINQSFGANDLITNTLQSVWKEGNWVNDYSVDYVFNQFGDLESETTRDWDTVGQAWINDIQIIRQYNTLGNITNVLRKQWNKGTSAWVNDVNQIVSYDEFFQRSANLIQSWNGSSWTDSLRTTYKYTQEGNIEQFLEEIWSGGNWRNVYREVYNYDNKERTIKIENWNADGSSWENDVLITNFLNEQGYIIIEQHEYWNAISSAYETGYYDRYDEDGTNPEYYNKTWNDTLNKFTGGLRFLNTYYASQGRDLKQRIIQEWDTLSSDWKNFQKTDYFWSELVSLQTLEQSGSYSVYPMPFNSMLNIEVAGEKETPTTLKIFDLNGRIVNETTLNGTKTTIDLSHLKNGVYFAEIHAKNDKSIIKLIKF